VRNFGSHIGRATQGEEVVDVNAGENWISIDPSANYDKTLAEIQKVVAGYPGLYRDVQTYLRERTKEVLSGTSDAIVVRIYGSDLDTLAAKGQEVRNILAGIHGTLDPHVELQQKIPQIQVQVNLDTAQRYGIKPGDVRRAASTLIAGEEAGSVFKDGKTYDVFVWGSPNIRRSVDSISRLLLDAPNGSQVPLGAVAQVQLTSSPQVISHQNGFRRIDVGTNVHGRDLGAVAHEIKQRLARVSLPQGFHTEVLGEFQERQSAQHRLLSFALAAGAGVFLLLRISFRSWRLAILSFLTLPIALVGGELSAYFFSAGTLSLGSLVGFFTVLGIVARNGIMLITHYQHLEAHEGESHGPSLVIRGAKERLAPILMTGLATALALAPLVVKGNVPGQEIEHPLAIVILGGLVASALLNLFILPTLYLRFGRRRQRRGDVCASFDTTAATL
jgi:Cu/Ag efflux pump CusA